MYSSGLLLKALALIALTTTVSAETTAPLVTDAPVTTMPASTAVLPVTTTQAPIITAPPTTAPIAPTPPPTTPPPAKCTTLENKDRLGFDIFNIRGDLASCDIHCKNTPACVTWTWSNYNGGTCWLKSREGKLVDKVGVTATLCLFNKPMVCNAFTDIDFVGMDIGNKPGKSAGDCCDLCNEFSGCTAYAWNTFNNGTCWLKKAVGQVEYKVGVVSSSTLPLYGGVCPVQYNVDYEGNDIGNKPATDAGICCGVCKANKDCKAYTWSNHNGGTCWMKSGKGKTVAKAGVTSATIAIF